MDDLRTFRLRLGLSQAEFARKIGITRDYVSAIETNKFKLSDRLRTRIRLVFEGKTAQQTPPQNPKEMKLLLNHAQVLRNGIDLIISEISKICEELETYDGGGGKDRKDG